MPAQPTLAGLHGGMAATAIVSWQDFSDSPHFGSTYEHFSCIIPRLPSCAHLDSQLISREARGRSPGQCDHPAIHCRRHEDIHTLRPIPSGAERVGKRSGRSSGPVRPWLPPPATNHSQAAKCQQAQRGGFGDWADWQRAVTPVTQDEVQVVLADETVA